MRLEEIALRVGAALRGDSQLEIHGVAPLDKAQKGEITFLSDRVGVAQAESSSASALIISPEQAGNVALAGRALLVVTDPKLAFARAIRLFHQKPHRAIGVNADLVMGVDTHLGNDCSIHPRVTLGDGVLIGDRVTLHPGVVVGDRVSIGNDTILFANVSVCDDTEIGARCGIHSGTVIGADGFSFVPDENGRQFKLLQVGRVVIEDDVEIGANCCVDRAGFGETRIRRGAKFDNLIQIGHNCDIGEDTVIAALCGFSGGTRVGRRCIVAGQIGTNQHVTIGDGTIITARAGVTKNVEPGKMIAGVPAMDYQKWRKAQVLFGRLPELFDRLRKLEKKAKEAS